MVGPKGVIIWGVGRRELGFSSLELSIRDRALGYQRVGVGARFVLGQEKLSFPCTCHAAFPLLAQPTPAPKARLAPKLGVTNYAIGAFDNATFTACVARGLPVFRWEVPGAGQDSWQPCGADKNHGKAFGKLPTFSHIFFPHNLKKNAIIISEFLNFSFFSPVL